jgi:hypothetical protein
MNGLDVSPNCANKTFGFKDTLYKFKVITYSDIYYSKIVIS